MNIKYTKNPLSWITALSLSLVVTTPLYALEFPSAPERDTPQASAGAGTRGNKEKRCIPSGVLQLQAFALGKTNEINTTSSQPQIFIYLPKTKAEFIEFSLTKENGENVNQQKIPINKGDHVIKIQIPYNAVLENDQTYDWTVSLLCPPRMLSGGKVIETGTIKKVTLSQETNTQLIQNPEILEKAKIYAEQRIWGETISLVSRIRNSQPQEWNELLTSVDLEEYADKEFYQVSLWE